MSAALPEKVAGVVGRALAARTDRRGFLSRVAVTAAALRVGAWRYATRRVSAFQSVTECLPGSLCYDGYTEFCCVINGGVNACPPGAIPAGWWRADFSSFCNGTRYYIDCNDFAPRIGCQCAFGCTTRGVYCQEFRYGQCHQEIAALGVIACRMVTCVPPYELDLGCSRTGAVDNATAEHEERCVSRAPFAAVAIPTVPDEEEILYILRCNETQQIAIVSEFRVAAYPIPEAVQLSGTIINCTKSELDAEIQARKDLTTKLTH